VSEAQAEVKARRNRREAMWPAMHGQKEIPFGVDQGCGSPA